MWWWPWLTVDGNDCGDDNDDVDNDYNNDDDDQCQWRRNSMW